MSLNNPINHSDSPLKTLASEKAAVLEPENVKSDWSPFLIPGGIRVMGSYHSLRGRVGIRRIPTGGEFNRCRVA